MTLRFLDVMSQPMYDGLNTPSGLPVCLREVGCRQIVTYAQQRLYGIEEFRCKLQTVLGKDILWCPIDVHSVVQESVSHHCSDCHPKRDTACELRKPISDDEDELSPICRLWQRTHEVYGNKRNGCARGEQFQVLRVTYNRAPCRGARWTWHGSTLDDNTKINYTVSYMTGAGLQ